MTYHLKQTPVAFFIFNRIDTAERVFAKIREAEPPKLFVISDGPRQDHPGEAEKVQTCRELIKQVDWDCEVLTNFSEENLGCGVRPKTGYDWVFEHVNEAIFLEDDCLPNNEFFRFCEELLDKYRDDTRVYMIGGTNFQPQGTDYHGESYYFSNIPQHWGWATWKRAWDTYDYDVKNWPEVRKRGYFRTFLHGIDWDIWAERYDELYTHKMTSAWDTQFVFNMWLQHGLCILPSVNLVSHIGFDGTHANGEDAYAENPNSSSGRPLIDMEFPLKHPDIIAIDYVKDKNMYRRHRGDSQKRRVRSALHFAKKRTLDFIRKK